MHIHDDHRQYGSALIQIAEDPHFTAINAIHRNGNVSRCSFRVNKAIAVYIKYRSKPAGKTAPAYSFHFTREHLAEIRRTHAQYPRLFLALVCVKAREICCLPYSKFADLVEKRRKAKGIAEDEYTVEVAAYKRMQLRVWVNDPGKKGTYLAEEIIPRSDFPRRLFEG